MSFQSIPHMIAHHVESSPDKPLFWEKKPSGYTPVTWRTFWQDIELYVYALNYLGYKAGDKISLLAENRYDWSLTDIAAMTYGMLDVPIYPVNTAAQCKYVIGHSESRIIAVSTREQLEKILSIPNVSELLDHIIVFDALKKLPEVEGVTILTLTKLKQLGRDHADKTIIKNSMASLTSETLATIIYTSGTTANPKGVCLTHGNFLSTAESCCKAIIVEEADVYLSFLPLSHVFERLVGLYLMLFAKAEVGYAENINAVAKNMQEFKPTIMIGVPRFFEKLNGKIQDALSKSSPLKKWLLGKATKTQVAFDSTLEKEGKVPLKLKLAQAFFHKLVLKKIHAKLGGRLRFFVSGGAPLSPELNDTFAKFGVLILQGYGLTETSAVVSVNRLHRHKSDAVGLPIDCAEVKIAPNGEILTRAPNTMKCYYKNEQATKEAITPDGWLHTGDIGHLDDEGFLYITDRIKDIIVTSGGKNVAPSKIENMLKNTRVIEHAMVVGDKRKYLTCLVVPNEEFLTLFAERKKINGTVPDLYNHPIIQKMIQDGVQKVNKNLASFEQLKKFRMITQEFSVDTDDLTPTLKVKKSNVCLKYKDLIEDMYAEA